jgi:hypothetical protein
MNVVRPDPEHSVLDMLVERGAGAIAHPGGTLLEHLIRVQALLEEWGASEDVQMAGLCHACYGTDGFPASLLRLDERLVLAAGIGRRAEGWVYLYASCDRGAVYPALRAPAPPRAPATAAPPAPAPLKFRDRFTGQTSLVAELDAAVLAELTAANELDLVMVNPAWAATVGAGLFELMRDIGPRLSPPARDGWNTWADLTLTQSDEP